jgi:hypothetical protein
MGNLAEMLARKVGKGEMTMQKEEKKDFVAAFVTALARHGSALIAFPDGSIYTLQKSKPTLCACGKAATGSLKSGRAICDGCKATLESDTGASITLLPLPTAVEYTRTNGDTLGLAPKPAPEPAKPPSEGTKLRLRHKALRSIAQGYGWEVSKGSVGAPNLATIKDEIPTLIAFCKSKGGDNIKLPQ